MPQTLERPSRVNARLDDEHVTKVEFLKRETGMSVSELVKRGIDRLYDEVIEGRPTALEILRDVGFIASGEGPADLSVRYKDELTELLEAKHGDR